MSLWCAPEQFVPDEAGDVMFKFVVLHMSATNDVNVVVASWSTFW